MNNNIEVDDIVTNSDKKFKKLKFRVLDITEGIANVVKMKTKDFANESVQKFNFKIEDLKVYKKNTGKIRYLKSSESIKDLLFGSKNQELKIVYKEKTNFERSVSPVLLRRKIKKLTEVAENLKTE